MDIQSIFKGLDESVVVRTMEDMAHHLNLHTANGMCPKSVLEARSKQSIIIRRWVHKWAEDVST